MNKIPNFLTARLRAFSPSRQGEFLVKRPIVFLLCSSFFAFGWFIGLSKSHLNPYCLTEVITVFGIIAVFVMFIKLSAANKKYKRAKQKAEAAEMRFDKIYQSGLIGLWFTNEDGKVVQANDAFLNILGYTQADLENGLINRLQLTPPEYKEITDRRAKQLRETGFCPPYQKEYFRKDGSRVPVLLGASLLLPGDISDMVAYALDVSELKAIEQREQSLMRQLVRKQHQMLQVFKTAPACIVIRKGPDLKIEFVNDAALQHNGLTSEQTEGSLTSDYFKNVKATFSEDTLRDVYNTGIPFAAKAYPLQYDRNGDGQLNTFWYDIVVVPTYGEDANIDGVVTYSFDVSEIMHSNELLKNSEERFRFITDSIPHKLWTSGPDGTATYYNKGWYDFTRTNSLDELRGVVWGLIHPDDYENTKSGWLKVTEEGSDLEIEHRLRRWDGVYIWHVSRVCVIKDNEDKPILWVGTSTNIHERKMAQESMITREQHFRILANNNTSLIWQTDADGNTIFVNDTWRAYAGITSEVTKIGDWINNIHVEDRSRAIEDFNIANKTRKAYDSKYRFKDNRTGEYRWMLDKAQPVWEPNFGGYIGVMTDITEQELAKQAIEEATRKKDEFFNITSHELKTPITTLKASLQILEQMLKDSSNPGKIISFVQQANKQTNKLTSIVNDLLDINRIQTGTLKFSFSTFKLDILLNECLQRLNIKHPRITLNMDIGYERDIYADKDRLSYVIMHLLNNAIKYSSKDKTVHVNVVEVHTKYKIEVIDHGIGIPIEKQKYVFDRFFRVHANSQNYSGFGLGLYICSEIIRGHDGEIGMESTQDSGSTFWFSIPKLIN